MLNTKPMKEVRLIIASFTILAVFVASLLVFVFYQINNLHTVTTDIYEHPLKVSNAALAIKSEILKINKNVKEIVLSHSQEESAASMKEISLHEVHIQENLSVIEKNILGKDGKKLQQHTQELLTQWKESYSEVIKSAKNNQTKNDIEITKAKNMELTLKLEIALTDIYKYAQVKANYFKNKSDSLYEDFEITEILTVATLIFAFLYISFFTVRKTLQYINKNEHLKSVLDVVRSVNQLIVREKDIHKLVDESCNILASKHVFSGAWIVLLDNDNNVNYVTGTDPRSDFKYLKNKIHSGWTPNCVEQTTNNGNTYSFIEKTKDNCLTCPLMDLYGGQGAFNIALKYNEEVFGYMTLSVDSKYIEYNDEIELLKEVAKDISYAIKNIELQNSMVDLKEFYSNVIDSVENLIFVKDLNFHFKACNGAFEKFLGKSRDEIIGKNDYDIVDKETADFFREHDIRVLAEKKSKSNFEWVTYPDGRNVYLLTVKSPLFNSKGKITGIVGNSIDLTKQKRLEDSLKSAKKRYEEAEKIGKVGSWEYIIESDEFWGSKEAKLIYGFEDELNIFSIETVEGCIVERERVHQALIDLIEKRAEYNLEFEIHPYDGSAYRIIKSVAKLEYDEDKKPIKVRGVIQDITEKANFISELKQKKAELETIIKEAPNPIILHSDGGKILMLNQAWIDATGYSMEEIPTTYDFVDKIYEDEDEKQRVKEHVKSLYKITSRINEGEFTFINKNKEKLTWQFSSAPLGIIDGKRTIISAAMDVTELKKKDELMMAQSRHAAMGEMIGMIAHQWRQPISVVSMIANNMLLDLEMDEFDAQSAKKYSNDILEQTAHLSKTIDDFRNFFKPEKAKSMVNMKNIIDETLAIVKDSLINNNIEYEIINNATSEVEVYQREVMQVFVNIITNAKDNFVQNNIKNPMLNISIFEDKEYVYTKICDNGGGVDEKVLPKIFDPYFTTKDEKTGTGLGLYMSKMIIEDHLNGVLKASNLDGGVCFIVKLPKKSLV